MKDNIVFKISKDTMTISRVKKETDLASLNQTNIIDTKDLKFTIDYITKNHELVANFLKVVIIKYNITTIVISNNDFSIPILELVNTWNNVTNIVFKENKPITLSIVLKLLENKYITNVDCYEIASILMERIDTNTNIHVKTRSTNDYQSTFMKVNLINKYSDIYYKKVIILDHELNTLELEDINIFMNDNTKLKLIKIYNFSNELITTLIDLIKKNKKKNICITIYEKNNDIKVINKTLNYLSKKEKKYLEENNIKFKINYGDEYRKKYFFKEINFKMLSTIISVVIFIAATIFLFDQYQRYRDNDSSEMQIKMINDIVKRNQIKGTIKDNNIDIEKINSKGSNKKTIEDNIIDIEIIDDTGKNETTTKKAIAPIYTANLPKVFDELLAINNETIGWLDINYENLSFPVVKNADNDFYLNHDFNKKRNYNGWIYMDSRNDAIFLDKNTIIYGHTIKNSSYMFGNLSKLFSPSWYRNSNNQIITFNNLYYDMKWQIFSIYKIKTTNEYLSNKFSSDQEYEDFIAMIKNNSIYDFNVEVTKDDYILTLSTCSDNDYRRVIHAKLISKEKNLNFNY